jgi:hypothetical protein
MFSRPAPSRRSSPDRLQRTVTRLWAWSSRPGAGLSAAAGVAGLLLAGALAAGEGAPGPGAAAGQAQPEPRAAAPGPAQGQPRDSEPEASEADRTRALAAVSANIERARAALPALDTLIDSETRRTESLQAQYRKARDDSARRGLEAMLLQSARDLRTLRERRSELDGLLNKLESQLQALQTAAPAP